MAGRLLSARCKTKIWRGGGEGGGKKGGKKKKNHQKTQEGEEAQWWVSRGAAAAGGARVPARSWAPRCARGARRLPAGSGTAPLPALLSENRARVRPPAPSPGPQARPGHSAAAAAAAGGGPGPAAAPGARGERRFPGRPRPAGCCERPAPHAPTHPRRTALSSSLLFLLLPKRQPRAAVSEAAPPRPGCLPRVAGAEPAARGWPQRCAALLLPPPASPAGLGLAPSPGGSSAPPGAPRLPPPAPRLSLRGGDGCQQITSRPRREREIYTISPPHVLASLRSDVEGLRERRAPRRRPAIYSPPRHRPGTRRSPGRREGRQPGAEEKKRVLPGSYFISF